MGYRSDVGLVLRANIVDDFYNIPKNMKKEKRHLFSELLSNSLDNNTAPNGDLLLTWRDIKWYENDENWYPHINTVMKFLDKLDLDDYLFCCIGESLDDVSEEGCYYDNPFGLCINRTLDYCCKS